MKYTVIIYWSAEDEAFIAEMPELAGCVADGGSPQAALQAVDTVAREWIETACELGRYSRAEGALAVRVIRFENSNDEGAAVRMSFDRETDTFRLQLRDAKFIESEEVQPGVILDFDEDGDLLAIEILGLKKRAPDFDPTDLKVDVA